MDKRVVIEGRKMYYRSIGKGKPVMLVHGFGEDGSVWNALAEELKESYWVLIPDLPGSGRSDLAEDSSMEGLALGLKRLMEYEGIKKLTVIGHSMGGYVALAFADKYPVYLNGLGLFHSSAYADTEEKKSVRRKGIEFIREHGPAEFQKTAIPNLFSQITREEQPRLVATFVESQSNFTADALVKYYEAMINRPARTNLLKTASFPVLFIMGEYDNAVPLKDSLEQCHLPDLSYIHIFKKSGHMGMLEEPQTTGRALKEFLKSLP